ncbi:MAG: CHASE2 domain-containing protein [Desulfobacula sp.]|nr:CHASE2 domain-containing protein [Desulfobacula sp.]
MMISDRLKKSVKAIGKARGFIMLGGLCITILVAVTYYFKPSYLSLLELKLYDTYLQHSYSPIQTNFVVIVDIDDQSLEEFGQWPWPRYRVARLLEKINKAGARSIGLDILFAEPDRTSPIVMKKALKRDHQIDIQFQGVPDSLLNNDNLLAKVLEKGSYVLGFSGIFLKKNLKKNPTTLPELKALQVRKAGAFPAYHYLFSAKDVISPLPVLLKSAKNSGFMNTITDQDGVLRRTPLLISWEKKIYPQLALATLLAASDPQQPDPVIKISKQGIESIIIGLPIRQFP